MRSLKDIIDRSELYHGFIKPIDPNQPCATSHGRDKKVKFPSPVLAKDISCPKCESTHGRFIFPDIWVCAGDCYSETESFSASIENSHSFYNRQPEVAKKRAIVTLESMGVPDLLFDATFDKSDLADEAKNRLKIWAKNPNGVVVFSGESGRGKTYVAVCCLDVYRKEEKDRAAFLSLPYLFLLWKNAVFTGKSEVELLDSVKNQELLVLDDLGMREPSPAFQDFLYVLIDYRLNKSLGTILTTNCSSAELRKRIGDPITSRILTSEVFTFTGKDKRTAKF